MAQVAALVCNEFKLKPRTGAELYFVAAGVN